MNNFILENVIPKIESIDTRLKNLESCRKALPQIDISIESTNTEDLISQIQKLMQTCANCNLKISVQLKEA